MNHDYSARHEKKPFDKAIYDVDDNAKYQVINWLKTKDFEAWVNPDDYGIDVLATKDNQQFGFEVEVKHNWDTDEFPFTTVHWAARKLKFIRPNTYFTMLNNSRTYVLVAKGETLQSASVVSKKTKYTDNELFVEVNVADCMIRYLDPF